MTSELESKLRRVPGSSRSFFSSASIFASSAEKNRSAGAPSSICLASMLDAPKLNCSLSPLCFS